MEQDRQSEASFVVTEQPSASADRDDLAQQRPRHRAPGRRRWLLISVLAAAIAAAATLLSFGLTRDPTTLRSALIGRPSPDFTLPRLDGSGSITLSALRGQVVVINFWASWCAACRKEHPNLMAAWDRYRDQGVVLIGINFQDTLKGARAYTAEMGGDWPLVVDSDSKVALAYGVYGVPETFFIGPDGVIARRQVGAVSYDVLVDQIQRLVQRRAAEGA